MRVLQVSDFAPGPTGGAEIYLDRVVDGLRAAGDEVELFAGEVTHTGLGRVLDFWDPRSRRLLAERAARFRPDVVHHHSILLELSVSVLGVPPGVPQVVTVHDPHLLGAIRRPGMPVRSAVDSWVKAPINRAVMRRRADVVLPVSGEVARWLRGAGFPAVEQSSAIVGPPLVPPRPVEDCSDVVFVGRLAPDKGADLLVRAFLPLLDRYPATRLRIAGDGEERDRVADAARAAGDRVELLGALDQRGVSELLGAARVVALPYLPALRQQASSLALVEAAMHGRPAVVGDDPAVREVANALGGVDVVAAGEVAPLTAALDRLLGDSDLAARQGAVAASGAQQYAVPVVTDRLRAIYRRLVEHRAGRG